jgi:hypothetical protein
MTSFWINVWRKVIRRYHKCMHDYNYILYRDCLDVPMKITLFQKIIHHRMKMDENS